MNIALPGSVDEARTMLRQIEVYEDRLACRSLAEFVKRSWHIVEPSTVLKWGQVLDVMCAELESIFHDPGFQPRLLMNVPPGTMKSLLVSVMFPAWVWTLNPSKSFTGAAHEQGLAIRDARKMRIIIESEWYQERWPMGLAGDANAKTYFENDKRGFRQAMPFGSLTGRRSDFVIIDDPLSAEHANSVAHLAEAKRIFHETLPTRVNNDESAIIMIMQRLNEDDPSGLILAEPTHYGYRTLILPMRYEPERGDPKDWRTEDGELLFEERYSERAVNSLEHILGSYGCTPAESPVLMSDLSLKRIADVREGDEIVGFARGEVQDGTGYSRLRLKKSRVKQTFVYRNQPVVKMTLDSGETIRCTADHKWYKKIRDSEFDYSPAVVGTPLTRVCAPRIPEVPVDKLRDAGWLAGFFDGDGSVSFVARHGNQIPVARICFYQGAGRNGPNCERLESVLTDFGFDYTYSCDNRKDTKKGVNYEYRNYVLRGKTLPLMQKFLHQIQPVKWRDRMVDGAYGAKFNMGKERVVKIEPDGCEDVYALETETGNYFVWGLASSNSAGQLQQRPVPREGGMFKLSWFDGHVVSQIPPGTRFKRWWDLAATKDAQAAYTAGVLLGKTPQGRYIIANVQRFQEEPFRRNALIKTACESDELQYKGIEFYIPKDPGAGGKVQTLDLVKHLDGHNVRGVKEVGDKESRAEGFSAQCEGGNVDLLAGDWNKPFLDELTNFPGSKWKDQVDAVVNCYGRFVAEPSQGGGLAAPVIL